MLRSWLAVGLVGIGSACSGGSGGAPDAAPIDAAAPPDARCVSAEPDASPPAAGCPARLPPAPDRVDEVLAVAGVDRCTIGYTDDTLSLYPENIRNDPDRLPFYDTVWKAPLYAIPWAQRLVDELDGATPSGAILAAAAQLGYDLGACEPLEAPPPADPLATAVVELIESHGGAADVAAILQDAADVPPALQEDLAVLVRALGATADEREAAIAALDETDRLLAFYGAPAFVLPPGLAQVDLYLPIVRGERFDYARMYGAAADLALAIESLDLARHQGLTGFAFRAETPLGEILVEDAADTMFATGDTPLLLVVDTGGNDTYLGGAAATADPEHGVSVLVDLGGDDTYAYVEVPDPDDAAPRLPSDSGGRSSGDGFNGPYSTSTTLRQGAASLGIALLYDHGGGVDRYRSLRMSQGFGALGVGVLYDDGGDDRYDAEAAAQGAGIFGIGLLIDGRGADERRVYNAAQGFGYARGVGALIDGGTANDFYYAEPDDVVYFSPQLPLNGNTSLAQGAGFGRRDDFGGNYMSGGVGILSDAGGDDSYTVSVFGQGTGYWFGTGILADAAGNDSYDGKWYVQGSAAHFALCLFLEGGGDDRYNQSIAPAATSIGVGHDWSIGIHLDLGGHDLYRAPGLSLGAGNANGIGILINVGGDDEYHAAGEPTLGVANLSGEIPAGSARETRPTFGVFLDVGGIDVYDVPGSTVVRGDGAQWVNNRRVPPLATEMSGGLDAPDGEVLLP